MDMASTDPSAEEINAERRRKTLLGPLPADFLRIRPTEKQQQEAADQQAALALHHQIRGTVLSSNPPGRLKITIAEARLVKNYGMARMDPYVRLRVGHCVYETHTHPNGGKTPRWQNIKFCLLPPGVNTIYVEIYDECSFTTDELIAWAHIQIPQAVIKGETHEGWFPLNGKQGDGKEGEIYLVLSYSTGVNPYYYGAPVMMVPSTDQSMFGFPQYAPVSVYTQLPQNTPVPIPASDPQVLPQIEEMFPDIDKEVIRSVYEANRFNKDLTVHSLLQMGE